MGRLKFEGIVRVRGGEKEEENGTGNVVVNYDSVLRNFLFVSRERKWRI